MQFMSNSANACAYVRAHFKLEISIEKYQNPNVKNKIS